MSSLPNQTKFNLFKGMWFYHKDASCEIHIYMSVMGKQTVYFNRKVVSSAFSLKMKTQHDFNDGIEQYSVISEPSNKAMTAFETTIRKNKVIIKSFSTHYNFDWKRILSLFVAIFGVNVFVEYFSLPDWTRWAGGVLVILVVIIYFSKTLITIKELENPITYDDIA